MATYVNQKDVVTTKSDHVAPGANPGVSPSVPTPPAGPVPTPFFYVAKSSSGTQVSGKVIINKKEFQDAIRSGRTVGDLALRFNQAAYALCEDPTASGERWSVCRACGCEDDPHAPNCIVATTEQMLAAATTGGGL